MALLVGTKLGRYEVHSRLGSGGMGEVYRAKDLRLGRDVAIKILPQHLSSNSEAIRRLELEARAISALNDANICTLYDVGHQDGVDFIVMEFLQGETLQDRLRNGPLPLKQVCEYGAQIARGLDKAHRKGILHRDLKPGNIMLTESGAKLLDFGLARASMAVATDATVSAAVLPSSLNEPVALVGTLPYMSPEQARGMNLDARSDIFSLGAVLYEMVTGRRAFQGNSQLSIVSAVIGKEPEPILAVAPLTSPSLNRLIGRCLAKDPEQRWQTARDVSFELEWIGETGDQPSYVAPQPTKTKAAWLLWMLGGVILGAGLLAGIFMWHSQTTAQRESYFLAAVPFTLHDLALAPDGHTVAAVGVSESGKNKTLWLYDVGGQRPRELAETEGASFPFWSPDGKAVAFFADGKLKRVDIGGGPAQLICDAPAARGGTWNRNGVIVFSPSGHLSGGLYRVSATGGTPTAITRPDANHVVNTHRWPMFLPDGKHFLYLAANVSGQTDSDAIFVGSLESSDSSFVTKATGNPVYAAPGYLLFCREKTLFAQKFDTITLKLSGEAVPLLKDVSSLPRILRNDFAASNGDVLVVQRGNDVLLSRLVWRDRQGNETGSVGKPDMYANIALAPNGKSVAFDKTDLETQSSDVWTYDFERGSSQRLTFGRGIDAEPVWSPDGKKIIFASARAGLFRLYIKNADGSEEEKLLPLDPSDDADEYPTSWSPDAKHFLYDRDAEATRPWVAELPDLKTHPLFNATETRKNAQFSPDGKWMAYTSNENGRWEIYVTSFPDLQGKWQVSNNGGTQPRWRRDGKELFYLAPDGKMMASPVTTGTRFDAGTPLPLFQANAREQVAGSELVMYDVTRDGQRFLINTQMETTHSQSMMVVLNWPAVLEK
jgi:Tol biopolymer transport system component/predicted Ser/Thr protein kinase